MFSDDLFMLPSDPFGRKGPKLDEILSFNTPKQQNYNNNKSGINTKQHQSRSNPIVNALDLTYNIATPNQNDSKKDTRYETYLKAAQGTNENNKFKTATTVNTPELKKNRNVAQTSIIFNTIQAIFPQNEAEIKEILNKYPANYDAEYLTNKVIQLINQ